MLGFSRFQDVGFYVIQNLGNSASNFSHAFLFSQIKTSFLVDKLDEMRTSCPPSHLSRCLNLNNFKVGCHILVRTRIFISVKINRYNENIWLISIKLRNFLQNWFQSFKVSTPRRKRANECVKPTKCTRIAEPGGVPLATTCMTAIQEDGRFIFSTRQELEQFLFGKR